MGEALWLGESTESVSPYQPQRWRGLNDVVLRGVSRSHRCALDAAQDRALCHAALQPDCGYQWGGRTKFAGIETEAAGSTVSGAPAAAAPSGRGPSVSAITPTRWLRSHTHLVVSRRSSGTGRGRLRRSGVTSAERRHRRWQASDFDDAGWLWQPARREAHADRARVLTPNGRSHSKPGGIRGVEALP